MAGRALNSVRDGEDILRCKELVDQSFKRFEVSTTPDAIMIWSETDVLLGLHIDRTANGCDIFASRS